MTDMFRVTAGASEPAAYAISALEEYGLQPQKSGDVIGKPVAYAVFDFGGGTTDFDFGVEEIPSDGRRKFVIHRFGAGGDAYLGGENILDLMAYEVYQDNLAAMREKKIPFVLPPGCKPFAGSETLVFDQADASQQAYMNSKRLAREMRCIWEGEKDYRQKFEQGDISLTLFSSQNNDDSDKREVSLKIDVTGLEKCIEARIRRGVENFFAALTSAFKDRDVYPIHIFLAGNSCKSAFVRPLFEEYIRRYEEKTDAGNSGSGERKKEARKMFVLHPPLGVEWPETPAEKEESPISSEEEEVLEDGCDELDSAEGPAFCWPAEMTECAEAVSKNSGQAAAAAGKRPGRDYDQQRTGKTGVAFGLLRPRIGGRDVKLIDDDTVDSEIPFSYYLGDIDRDGCFRVRIDMDIPYGQWIKFICADEPEFELYYTKEPNCLEGSYGEDDVERVRCRLDSAAWQEADNAYVFIRKAAPSVVEYALGYEEDFKSGAFQGKICRKELK